MVRTRGHRFMVGKARRHGQADSGLPRDLWDDRMGDRLPVKLYQPSVQVKTALGWFQLSHQPTSKRKAEEWLSQTLSVLSNQQMRIKSPCIRVADAPIDESISDYPLQGEGIQGEWQDALL